MGRNKKNARGTGKKQQRKSENKKQKGFHLIEEKYKKGLISKQTWQEYQMCKKKTRYNSEIDAMLTAARTKTGDNIYWYKCPICKGWHLAHKTPKFKQEENTKAKTLKLNKN